MKIAKFYRPFIGSKKFENDLSCCEKIKVFTWGGGLENILGLIYVPNIRAYILLNNHIYKSGYEYLDYCPFCGSKFPERLDDKLSEILKLESWKDYKKAPSEFHTDEWWRKRGL